MNSHLDDNQVLEKVHEHMSNVKNSFENIQKIDDCSVEMLEKMQISLKYLRNSCCRLQGIVQNEIVSLLPTLFMSIDSNTGLIILKNVDATFNENFNILVWQLIANLTVNNFTTQDIIWKNFGNILKQFFHNISPCTEIQLMTLYNIVKGQSFNHNLNVNHKEIFSILLQIWSNILKYKVEKGTDFLHIFFEEYLCNNITSIVPIYATRETEERINALKYIATYIRNGSPNGKIQKILLEFIAKEFKKKSDYILRANEGGLKELYPYEVLTLLEVISIATGDEFYSQIYENDQSLFLNVGGLLCSINELGKNSNIFTPMEKLTEVAPNSKISSNFENEISFQLRTYLVRTLANLLYKNRKNQEYVRELNIISAILDSTRPDARNPLIKEWSILAIRNMCENCTENQEIIQNLSKVGEASKEVLTELNLEMGSLRISPKE